MGSGNHPVFAFFYDALMAPVERRFLASLRSRIVEQGKGRVLEVGAGTGLSLKCWERRLSTGEVTELVAAEFDPHMLRRLKKKASALPGIRLLRARIEELPFKSNSFDTVAVFLTLCSVENPLEGLRELNRVLKPEGTLLFLEHVRASGLRASLQGALSKPWSRLAGGCVLNRDTLSTLKEAGFRNISYRDFRIPFPLFVLVAGAAKR